jgi:hypothetical protein
MKILHNKKKKPQRNLLTHNIFQIAYEYITYKEFSSNMKQLNDEHRTIVDDILQKKKKKP